MTKPRNTKARRNILKLEKMRMEMFGRIRATAARRAAADREYEMRMALDNHLHP